jgi:hypothetical protein
MNQLLETIPAEWSDADERFFSVVARLLPAEFLLGATVMLMSYDDEAEAPVAVATTPLQGVASTPQPAGQAPGHRR